MKTRWYHFVLDSKTIAALIEVMKTDQERIQRLIVGIITVKGYAFYLAPGGLEKYKYFATCI